MTDDDNVLPFFKDMSMFGVSREMQVREWRVSRMSLPILRRAVKEMRALEISDGEIANQLDLLTYELRRIGGMGTRGNGGQ